MDITIKVKDRFGKMHSSTFIGDKKEDVVQDMQKYIDKNKNAYIHILFSSEEESNQFTYDELFNPK
tara:strand:- start:39 stop:236 length:198 start_codon:yes stop_codon:yes gene_type:complete